MDHITLYVLVMKLFGIGTVVVGSIVLYLVIYHSGKIGREYKYALVIHHSLLFLSQIFWNLLYIPTIVAPYVAVYPGGFLTDLVPSIALFVFQMSVCMVSITSFGPLFHLRLLAVLSHDHFLARRPVKYFLFGCYFIPSILINPFMIPFACWDQDNIKADLLEDHKVYDERLFHEDTVAVPMASPITLLYLYMTACGSGTFFCGSVLFIIMTFSALDNMKTALSEVTKAMQRKLIKSLIAQAMFYNGFFLGISALGSLFAFIGSDSPFIFMIIFWTYSMAFILGSILLIATNAGYRRAVFKIFTREKNVGESVLVVTR